MVVKAVGERHKRAKLTRIPGTKSVANPILNEEPHDLDVTGFRDPSIAAWTAMDEAKGSEESVLYATISGGIRNIGPNLFLYAIDANDMTNWEYLHPLVETIPTTFFPSGRWAGDLGLNWECANFFTLSSYRKTEQRNVVIVGSEGGTLDPQRYSESPSLPACAHLGKIRHANWFFGDLRPQLSSGTSKNVKLSIETAGLLDWGDLYACQTFSDDTGRRLMWGWIVEEDLTTPMLEAKGFTGCLGVIREVYLMVLERVIGTCKSTIEEIGSLDATSQADGTYHLITLGFRPLPELARLRRNNLFSGLYFTLSQDRRLILRSAPLHMDMELTVRIGPDRPDVSLHLRHNADLSVRTSIVFSPAKETIRIIRHHSNDDKSINRSDATGSFTLFQQRDTKDVSKTIFEPLKLRVFLDGDVLEIFANDRFSIASRIYTVPEFTGVSVETRGSADIQAISVWEMDSIGVERKACASIAMSSSKH